MDKYKSIGIAAGALMIPWVTLSQHLRSDNKKREANIFINLEGVLRNLTLENKLNSIITFYKQKAVLDLESAILNLVANYRSFFIKESYQPNIYLYYTKLDDVSQQMSVCNKYYRSYYRNKYIQNPNFKQMGALMQDVIIPEVTLILKYVPKCHLVTCTSFDSSIIPMIIASRSTNANFIISTDIFDTLYLFNPNFHTIYVKRRYSNLRVMSEIDDIVQSIVRDENPFDLSIFRSELYYKLLLSIKGSKIRNISSAKGFGYGKFLKLIKEGCENDVILKDFESIESVIQLFPEKYRDDIKSAFQCTDLETQFNLLSETDIDEVFSQVIDNVDIESLNNLNNQRFLEFPLNLQGLIG